MLNIPLFDVLTLLFVAVGLLGLLNSEYSPYVKASGYLYTASPRNTGITNPALLKTIPFVSVALLMMCTALSAIHIWTTGLAQNLLSLLSIAILLFSIGKLMEAANTSTLKDRLVRQSTSGYFLKKVGFALSFVGFLYAWIIITHYYLPIITHCYHVFIAYFHL